MTYTEINDSMYKTYDDYLEEIEEQNNKNDEDECPYDYYEEQIIHEYLENLESESDENVCNNG